MFKVRDSTSGKYAYLFQVERTPAARYAATVVRVITHSTAIQVPPHLPIHEHYGEWPEEAIDKAFQEAERLVLSQPRTGDAGRPRGTRD